MEDNIIISEEEISQLRRRVEELERENAQLRQLQNIIDAVMQHENIGLCILQGEPPQMVLASRGLEIMTGYSREELLTFKLTNEQNIIHRDFVEDIKSRYKERVGGGKNTGTLEFIITKKNGTPLNVQSFTYMINYNNNPALVVSLVDITHIRETEKALRQSTERYRLLFERTPTGVFFYDTRMIIKDINQRFIEIMQSTREKLVGFDLNTINDRSILPCFKDALDGKNGYYEGYYNSTTSGARVAIMMKTVPVYDEEGNIAGGAGIIEDIIKRYEAEEALRESEKNFRELIERSPLPIAMVSRDDKIVYSNMSCKELLGYSFHDIPDLGTLALKGFPDPVYRSKMIKDWQAGFRHALEHNTKFGPKEYKVTCQNGTVRDVEFHMVPVGNMIFIIMNDMTKHRRAEAELLRTKKIESIGILAGGIAHDFNNILTAILGNISLARLDLAADDNVKDVLGIIEKATWRARDLTHQLLTFSKGGAPVKKITSVRTLLLDTVEFVLSGSNIRLDFTIPDDLWDADVDEGQISQVIHNIVLNSRQAMTDAGTILIKAENYISQGAEYSVQAGNYVRITIEDNGPGIPDDIIANIFDPFFTTKDSGSGLGLSVTYSIIKKHGGDIRVYSSGRGVAFEMILPASAEKAKHAGITGKTHDVSGAKILVMDDDRLILELCNKMLRRMGYDPYVCDNAAETIRIYKEAKESGEPFDCVIMDLTIPGEMGGREVNSLLKDYDPGIKSIVSSGYSNDPVMSSFREYGFSGVASKPYSYEDLEKTIHELITQK